MNAQTPHPSDDNQPATKADVRLVVDDLAQATNNAIEDIREEIKQSANQLRSEMSESEKRIIAAFEVVAENIHKDVAGANKDQVDLLVNQVPDHEERIVDLEENAGLSVGPRNPNLR